MSAPGWRRAYPGPGQAVLLTGGVFAVQLLCGVVIGVAMVAAAGGPANSPGGLPPIPATGILAMNVLAFGLALAWAARANRGENRQVWLGGRAGPGTWSAALSAGLGTTVLVSACGVLLQRIAPMPDSWNAAFAELVDFEHRPVLTVLTVILLPAVAEEALFRGYILRGLLDHVRPRMAVLLSTVLFTALHLNLWQIPVGLALGLLCGWVYLRTRSLPLCITLHGVNNAVAVLADRLPFAVPGFNVEGGATELHPWWFDLLGLGLAAAGVVAVAVLTRGMGRPPPLPPETAPGVPSTATGDPSGEPATLSRTGEQ